ncbi:MAG: hypothetical protein ACOYXA_06145 [Bacteroidota bacterium]
MIGLLPSISETVVLALSAEEVVARLHLGVEQQIFRGAISNTHFSLHVRVIRPTQFQPVVHGLIEPTSRGSILFIEYQLLPSTRLYLIFCALALLVAAGFIAYFDRNLLLAGSVLLLLIVLRWVAWSNLKLQAAAARKTFMAQLS